MPSKRPNWFLEQALLWNFIIHLWAMATMASFVLPGLPGGTSPDDLTRITYVAEHPWLWPFGWLPWHLCAAVDLVTGIAMLRTPWIPKLPAALTLLVSIFAVAVEQSGEIPWSTSGPSVAAEAIQSGRLQDYKDFESSAFQLTVVYGASLYVVMAWSWTWCFAVAGAWNRWLTILTPIVWGALSVGSIGLLLPKEWRPNDDLVGATNGVGFVLYEVWVWLVYREVRARSN